jgi:hypothetical protein
MNLPGHVEVARVENTRYAQREVSSVEQKLNDAVGIENVDWWIKEYYTAQCSYVIFTVPTELEEQAQKAL